MSGTLRLTATRQAYDAVMRPVLPAFTAAHPGATVEVLVDYGFRDIVADGIDAGIGLGEKVEQDMVAAKVGPELRMAVVASPAYLTRHGTPGEPRDLMAHCCINYRLAAAGTIYAWEFERDGKPFEVRVPGPLTFNDPGLMLDCALEGLGVAYLLEHEAAPHVGRGALVRLLAEWTVPFPGFFLYYPSRRHLRPVFAAFLALLRRPPPSNGLLCRCEPRFKRRRTNSPTLSDRRSDGRFAPAAKPNPSGQAKSMTILPKSSGDD